MFVLGCNGAAPRAIHAPPPATPAPSAAAAARAAVESAAAAQPHVPPQRFGAVIERARELAQQPPRPVQLAQLPEALRTLTYEQYRGIRFRPERSLWRGEPGRFEVQFFHPGHYFRDLVNVRSVQDETLQDVAFAPSLFAYDHVPAPASAEGLGFTGLRLHAPINTESYRDEVIVFQGASYFRSLGRHQVFGLSARGLAIDTGEPVPEEFPRFTEIELIRPAPDHSFIWVLALLESRRATGAYAFRVKPGPHTEVEVNMRVFFREKVTVAGVAPLTSMYLFGEEAPGRFKTFAPKCTIRTDSRCGPQRVNGCFGRCGIRRGRRCARSGSTRRAASA